MSLPERSHETGDLPVVLAVDVRPGRVQQLDDVEVAAVGREPQRGVALLVADVDLGVAGQQELNEPVEIEDRKVLSNHSVKTVLQ